MVSGLELGFRVDMVKGLGCRGSELRNPHVSPKP